MARALWKKKRLFGRISGNFDEKTFSRPMKFSGLFRTELSREAGKGAGAPDPA
jgi:hypothetical protein